MNQRRDYDTPTDNPASSGSLQSAIKVRIKTTAIRLMSSADNIPAFETCQYEVMTMNNYEEMTLSL